MQAILYTEWRLSSFLQQHEWDDQHIQEWDRRSRWIGKRLRETGELWRLIHLPNRKKQECAKDGKGWGVRTFEACVAETWERIYKRKSERCQKRTFPSWSFRIGWWASVQWIRNIKFLLSKQTWKKISSNLNSNLFKEKDMELGVRQYSTHLLLHHWIAACSWENHFKSSIGIFLCKARITCFPGVLTKIVSDINAADIQDLVHGRTKEGILCGWKL